MKLKSVFLTIKIGVVFITESQEDSRFYEFVEQSQNIFIQLENEKLDQNLKGLVDYQSKTKSKYTAIVTEYTPEKLLEEFIEGISKVSIAQANPKEVLENVKYLICKCKSNNQYFSFKFNNYELITQEERQVLNSYTSLYDMYKNLTSNNLQNNFFHYVKDELYTNVIHANENYILFVSYSLFCEYEDIYALTIETLKSIKAKESYYFIKKIYN